MISSAPIGIRPASRNGFMGARKRTLCVTSSSDSSKGTDAKNGLWAWDRGVKRNPFARRGAIMSLKSKGRRGLSLIDLISVLGVLLFLLAMLAPFLFRLRGRAAETESQNNLRNIVLATHNFESNEAHLPPANGKGPRRGSLMFLLLPYLEQQALYDSGPVWEAGTFGRVLPLFIHPGDKSAPPGNKFEDWLATCNYAGNWLVFGEGKLTLHTIGDGTSNTIFYAERYQVCKGQPCAWGYDKLYYWAP